MLGVFGWQRAAAAALAAGVLIAGVQAARACPFCSAASVTLSEEIKVNDVAVIAKLVKRPTAPAKTPTLNDPQGMVDAGSCQFEIVRVLKGEGVLGPTRQLRTLYFGDLPVGSRFLVFGSDPTNLAWSTPLAVSEASEDYIAQLPALPEKGADRLVFFQKYLEHADPLLATDSYDEFTRATYGEFLEMKPRIDHDKMLAWVQDAKLPATRRRLYFNLLGVCGQSADIPIVEGLIRDESREVRAALDAMIACYLNLRGAEGLPLIEDLFLRNEQAEYTDTYSAIMALRFHGQETDVVPRERVLASLRIMLDRPKLADLIIPDLARWQDWSVMDRLVKLFKEADKETSWVRLPVVNYLRACPLPEAKAHLAELEKLDPDTIRRANAFYALTAPPAGTGPAATGTAAPTGGAPVGTAARGTAEDLPAVGPPDKPPPGRSSRASPPESGGLGLGEVVALAAQVADAPETDANPVPIAAPEAAAAPAAAPAAETPAVAPPTSVEPAAPPAETPADLAPLPERPVMDSAPFSGDPLTPAERDQLPGMDQFEFREMPEPDSVSRPLGARGMRNDPLGESLDPLDDPAAAEAKPFSGLMGAGVLMVSAGAALLVLALLIWIFSGSPKRVPVQVARRP